METTRMGDYIESELYREGRKDTYTEGIHKSENIHGEKITWKDYTEGELHGEETRWKGESKERGNRTYTERGHTRRLDTQGEEIVFRGDYLERGLLGKGIGDIQREGTHIERGPHGEGREDTQRERAEGTTEKLRLRRLVDFHNRDVQTGSRKSLSKFSYTPKNAKIDLWQQATNVYTQGR